MLMQEIFPNETGGNKSANPISRLESFKVRVVTAPLVEYI